VQGEVYSFQHCGTEDYGQKNCDPSNYGATPSFFYPQNIAIDFSSAILQPPTPANFTLTFSPWPNPMPQQATITGTLSIPPAAANPGPVNLSYVIEPVNAIFTVPSANVCPGNTYAFNPGNTVISNGSPPLSVTIPQGQTSATFTITVQTLPNQAFNVQVVAWQTNGTAYNGAAAPNVQSAWCLTVPGA
jgi:hypothetical protein